MSAFAPSLASGIGTRDAMAVSRMSVPHEIELIDMLNKNLTKENSAQLMLMCFLLGKVLSAEQFCRVSVLCML